MSRPTRITFLITDLHLGGTPRILHDLASGLQQKHLQVSIISLKPLPSPHSAFRIPHSAIPIHSLNLHSPRQFPAALPKLIHLLNTIHPDILYSFLIHANTLATLALPFVSPRPRFIQSIHTLQENPRWHWALQGLLAPFADALIVPAQPILDRIARFGYFQRGLVIPNGIAIDRFANASPPPPDQLPWPSGSPVIGYVGRFDPVKNLPLLLRAFARLTMPIDRESTRIDGGSMQNEGGSTHIATGNGLSVHLALVGYGPEENALRALATSLHIAPFVHFLGPTTTPEHWYKSFTVACLPSAVEGFGLMLVEAMAAGVPVVAIRTPVAQGIVRDGIDGRLVDFPGSIESLASVIKEVIKISTTPPLVPPSPPPADLSYLRATFSVEHMVELHAQFFKNF